MPPQHRYYRDPDERAAAQATGCLLGFLLIAAFALYEALRARPAPYTPIAPDNPNQVPGKKTRTKLLIAAIMLFFGVNTVFVSFMVLPSVENPNLITVTLTVSCGFYLLLHGSIIVINQIRLYLPRQQRAPLPTVGDTLGQPIANPVNAPRTYTIYPPRTAADLATGTALVRSLLASTPHLTFAIVAEADGLTWQVIDPLGQYSPQVIIDHLRSHIPQATVIDYPPLETYPLADGRYPFYRQHLLFQLTNEYAAPLPFFDTLKTHDPLVTMTRRMEFLRGDLSERVTYGLYVLISSPDAKRQAEWRLSEGQIRPLVDLAWEHDDRAVGLDERLVKLKLADHLYHCFLVVTLESKDRRRLKELAHIAQDISTYRVPGHNALVRFDGAPVYAIAGEQEDRTITFQRFLSAWVAKSDHWRDTLLVLSPAELAALWHLPDETYTSTHIQWAAPAIPASLTASADDRLYLGESTNPGRREQIGIGIVDRAYHCYITGKTGMGKSTLIHNLVRQDVAAGRGVVVIEPHGKLIDDILNASITNERMSDVVLLECGNTNHPVPLNPLRIPDGVSFTTAFNYLYWVMSKIYESVWRVGRMDLVFRNLLHALLCDPDATPLDIERLFTSTSYRASVIDRVKAYPEGSQAVINYWRGFGKKARSEQMETATPILNRTGIFLGNRTLENMTCHPHMLNFQALVRERKVVLVNLSGEAIRSEVGSLGALFLAGFYMASEALGYIPDNAPPRYFLYLDEAERFLTNPIEDMYAQARKCGLSLTLANQYLDQLTDDTLHGILGNVGTKLMFECGDKDARTLAPQVEPEVTRQQLQNLGAYHIAVKTRSTGRTLPAFVLQTNKAPTPRSGIDRTGLTKAFRANAKLLTARKVRAWIDARYADTAESQPEQPEQPHSDTLSDYE